MESSMVPDTVQLIVEVAGLCASESLKRGRIDCAREGRGDVSLNDWLRR